MSHINCLKRLKKVIFSFVLIPSLLLLLFSFLLSDTTYAQTYEEISLQGKIVRNDYGYEGLNVVNGTPSCVTSTGDTCDFQVKYYSASTAGTLYLTEKFTDVEIGDYGGVFNLSLGSGSFTAGTHATLDAMLSSESSVYMQIEFAPTGDGATFSEVFTRTPLNASAYSIRSKYSEGSVNDAFKFYDASSVSSVVEGSVYYDTDDNELKLYNGSSWVSVGNAGASAWTTSDVGTNYSSYMSDTGIGAFSNFTLDLDDDRMSIHTDVARGGLSIFSSYSSTGAWPLVAFEANNTSFDASILDLTQFGTGNIITGNTGSTLSYQVDYLGDLHLANNGVAYFEPFASLPGSGSLNPNTGEGCLYSYGGDIYWDPSCDGTASTLATGGSSLWTDDSTYTYLNSTTDDLVLGGSTLGTSAFFFDVSEKRIGIGTGTPQSTIDIAGASSNISNTSGDITITPANNLVVANADINLSKNWANIYGEDLKIWGNNNTDIYLQSDSTGGVGIGTTTLGVEALLTLDSSIQVTRGGSTMVLLSDNVEGANDYFSGLVPSASTGFVGLTSTNEYYSGHYTTSGGGFRGMRTAGAYGLELGLFYYDQSEAMGENSGSGMKVHDGWTRFYAYGVDAGRMEYHGLEIGYEYPTGVSVVCSDTGGSLAAGTYHFTVATQGGSYRSQAFYEDSCTVTTGTTGSVTITWDEVGDGTSSAEYAVYKGTSSWGQDKYKVVSGSPYTWTTDTGASSGSPPRTENYSKAINISNNSNTYFDTGYNFGIGLTNPGSKLDVSGDARISSSLNVGPSGDSGSIRYNTTNNELEFSNDGSSWIPLADAIKTTTLSAEYSGAVMAADGSNNTGFMTSDAEGSSSNSMNYYEWNSSETTLQDYDVRLRFTIPHDFSSWGTNAFTLNFVTEANASTNNKVDIYVYEESSGTVDDSSTNQYSSTAGVWQTTNIQGADLGECNAAGETCLILIRMYSANDNFVRIGDIDVNYNRKL